MRRLDQVGAVAIVTAVCLPVLFMMVGFALDYGYASYINQRLAKAADAAVLSSVSQSGATAVGGYGNTSWLQMYGADVFVANTVQLPISGVNFNITVASDGNGGVIANATYSYSSPTFFSGILGKNAIPLSGSVQSTARPITYINYYILVDASQSMGIGASATDMQNLYDRVVLYNNGSGGESGCVFGCHVTTYGQTVTNEYLAHSVSPTITLRIDAAISAIQSIISTAETIAGSNKNIKFGLYTIQDDPTTGSYLQTVAAPSTNYSSLNTSAANIDLGNNVQKGDGDSDFQDELSYFNSNVLPSNGSGASATSPLNYVFIVTDGLTDTPNPSCPHSHCTSAFDASNCTSLKAKATVGVIYTTYLPIYNNNNPNNGFESDYSQLAAPYVSQIPSNLQSCATSSNYYFQADDGTALVAAMQSLFQRTQPTTARLTQ